MQVRYPKRAVPSPEALLRAALPSAWRRPKRSPITAAVSVLLILALAAGAIAWLRAAWLRASAAATMAAQPVAPENEAPPSLPDPAPDMGGALPTTDRPGDQPQPPPAQAETRPANKGRLANRGKPHRKHHRARRDDLDEEKAGLVSASTR